MNHDEKQFEELMKKVSFDDKPDYRHRDKLHQELLAAYAGRQWREERQSRQNGIWRTIMQNRTLRLAAVAAVIAVVGIASWAIFHHDITKPMMSSVELLAKAQAAEQALFKGDKIVHIMSEITVYRNSYNPKVNELIEKLANPKLSGEELDKINRELISSWMAFWLPMCSMKANGDKMITEIRLAKDANQPYTIYDNAWYEPSTGRFVRTMETDDKLLFANAYDGESVSITETTPDGKIQLKGESITADFKAPENPAEFLGMTAGVRQCLVDRCFTQPVQGIAKDTLEDGTPVLVYTVGFRDFWNKLSSYYLFKIRQTDEIIAQIEYFYMGQPQLLVRRVASEQVDKPGYSWNLAELSSKDLAEQTPGPVTVAADVAIPNVSVRHMVDKAEFEPYIFATDPNWTQKREIIDVVDPMNPPKRMFVIAYTPKDDDPRMVLLIQSLTHNKYMSTMTRQMQAHMEELKKQGVSITEFANGCKLYRNTGGEAYWTEVCFKSSGIEPAKDRCGIIVETPAGTFPLIAVNGPVTDEELKAIVNSLIPAKDYQVK
jgi:hypothetical protein